MLEERIDDAAFPNLIEKWLKAGILDMDGAVLHPETGTPRNGVVSTVLAKPDLRFALDLRFEKDVKTHCKKDTLPIRYADDFARAFRHLDDASRFCKAPHLRLGKFRLAIAPEKTKMMRFSRFHPGMERRFTFPGFETYWTIDRKGLPRVMQRTAPKKSQGACGRIKDRIKKNRHLKRMIFIRALNGRLRGHFNYYGVAGNSSSLWRVHNRAIKCAFKWPNRRGGRRRSFTWIVIAKAMDRFGILKPGSTGGEEATSSICMRRPSYAKASASEEPMRENRAPGSVRVAPGNMRSCRQEPVRDKNK
jgi:hypothetical protein